MNRVVFMVDTISHAYSSVGVARRLQAMGYTVEYWGGATNASKRMLESQGLSYHDVDGLWSRYHEEIRLPTNLSTFGLCTRPDILIEKLIARRRRMLKVPDALDRVQSSLNRLITTRQPAFVIIDPFLLAYYPFLWARNVSAVVLCTKPLAIRDPLVPPYDSYLMPPRSALGRLMVWACWQQRRIQDLGYRALVRMCDIVGAYTYYTLLRQAAERSGFPLRQEIVRRWIQPDLRFRSLHEWALWLPEMDLPRKRAVQSEAKVSYIGPSVYASRREDVSIDLERAKRFLIYVAVGTARFRWRDNVAFLRKVIEAFRHVEGVSVVISTSDARGTAALGTPPANVRVCDFAPQLALLDRADLVITHAGAGTLRECIETEVPLLAYPRNHDQMGNSARIVFRGLGLRGRRRVDTPADIRNKTMRILHDSRFRENLRGLKSLVRASQDTLLANAVTAVSGPRSLPAPLSVAFQVRPADEEVHVGARNDLSRTLPARGVGDASVADLTK